MTSARFPAHPSGRYLWPLVLLLGMILFPFGWLAEIWPLANRILGSMFPDVNAHAIGHTSLFLLLGVTLLVIFPYLLRHPGSYALLLLVVGIGQEVFQLAYKQRPLVFDDFRDLATDMIGGLIALGVVMIIQRWRNHKPKADVFKGNIPAVHNPGDTNDR
jgi:glycopeptide antibiotics resistance protein